MTNNNIKYIALLIINILFANSQYSSIIEKQSLADNYYDAQLYEDAFIIYEEIYELQQKILKPSDKILLNTIYKLYELSTLLGKINEAKQYLQKYIDVQSSFILKEQNAFVEPLKQLRNISLIEKNTELIHKIDSLLLILSTNSNNLKKDSLNISLPIILINTKDSLVTETEYSQNDIALDQIKEGINLLNNKLYTQLSMNFRNALNYNAPLLDVNYFLNINFGDLQNKFYQSLEEEVKSDSLLTLNYFFLGLLNLQNNNFKEAINNFKIYHSYHPNDIKGLLFLGKIYYQLEEWLDATFYFYRSLKIDLNDTFSNLYLAKSLIKMHDYNEAINILKLIIKNDNSFETNYNLGFSFYYIHEYNSALKYLTQALLLNPNYTLTYYYLGLCYKNQNQNKKALDAFNKVIDLDINFGLAHYELGKIYQIILNDEKAIYHFEKAKINESIEDLNFNLGMLYYNNGYFIQAINPLKEYLVNNMNDFNTLEILGEICIITERYNESIDIYLRLLEQDPSNEKYYLNIANSFQKLNDFNNAINNYKEAISLNDENYQTYVDIGNILNKNNNFIEAEYYLKNALNCGSSNKNLLVQLGLAYAGQGKFLQSLIAFKDALKFSLEDPIIHYQLGVVYKELNIFDLSIDNFLYFLKSHPNDDITLNLIGESYFHLNHHENAITYFKKAYQINNNYNFLFNIGKSYEILNDYNNAAKYFKNVIKVNPEHVKSRVKLISIYTKLNKRREARKECEIIYMLDRSKYNAISFCNS